MRIGVDARCRSNRRGHGRFALALVTALLAVDPPNHYVFFADDGLDVDLSDCVGWCNCIAQILSDIKLRDQMRGAGLTAARRLCWQNAAREWLSIFEKEAETHVAAA
jgi:hypothetical protein